MAQDLLDRFFRDAEGKTNRQIDVYFTLEDMGVPRERAEEGLEYLSSRGLINMFGPDVAFLTELGIAAISEEQNISKMQKQARDFAQARPPQNAQPAIPRTAVGPPASDPRASDPRASDPRASDPRASAASGPVVETAARKVPPHSDRPQLRFQDSEGSEHVVQLGWSCTIGRVEGNTIHLPDQRASKKHAEVKFEGNKFVLSDLGAANGTLVNGSYIDAHVLIHGDEILIGRTTLVFEAPRVITPPPREPAATRPTASEGDRPVERTQDRPTERPAPSESRSERSGEIRVVKGRPESVPRTAPQAPSRRREAASFQEDDLFEHSEPARPRVPPFPGPSKNVVPIEEPDDLFAPSVQAERSPTSDLFESDTGKRPAQSGDLFADPEPDPEPGQEPSAHDLFSEAAIPRPAVEAPSNLFDEEPNTVFARAAEQRVLDELPIEPPDTMEPLQALDPLSPILDEPELPVAPSKRHESGLEPTMVNASLHDLAHESGLEVEEPWAGDDAHTPPDARMSIDPLIENPPLGGSIDLSDVAPDMSRDSGLRPRARGPAPEREETVLAPGGMAGGEEDADTEGATPPSSRPGLRDVVIERSSPARSQSDELPRWGDEKRPVGSHPAFAQGSAQHIATLEREEPGEELPEAEPDLSDLSMSGVPLAARSAEGGSERGERGDRADFHQTLKRLRTHVERADLPDRDRVLAAIDLLERHPYVRVALNLSEDR